LISGIYGGNSVIFSLWVKSAVPICPFYIPSCWMVFGERNAMLGFVGRQVRPNSDQLVETLVAMARLRARASSGQLVQSPRICFRISNLSLASAC
jgi:hypothetical protein